MIDKVEECRLQLEDYALKKKDKMNFLRGNIRLKLKEIEDILKDSKFLKMLREVTEKKFVYESLGNEELFIYNRFNLKLSKEPLLYIYKECEDVNLLCFNLITQELEVGMLGVKAMHFEYSSNEKEFFEEGLLTYNELKITHIDEILSEFLKLFNEENILDEIRQFLIDYLDKKIKEYDKEVIQSL